MRCREAGVRPSMGSVSDCFDAMCETSSQPGVEFIFGLARNSRLEAVISSGTGGG